MPTALRVEPLRVEHLDELSTVLLEPSVYAHIEPRLPTVDEFKLGLSRAIAGPRPDRAGQIWLNYLVRHESTGEMVGRLEATVHNRVAEVAILFGSAHWGRGLASEGLLWLHSEVGRTLRISEFWATTVAANTRCQALLSRCGYTPAQRPWPPLMSYADGDLVFVYESGSKPSLRRPGT